MAKLYIEQFAVKDTSIKGRVHVLKGSGKKGGFIISNTIPKGGYIWNVGHFRWDSQLLVSKTVLKYCSKGQPASVYECDYYKIHNLYDVKTTLEYIENYPDDIVHMEIL